MASEDIEEPIPKRSDIEKGLRTIYLNRVAHMGMMLDKVNRQNRRAERIEKFASTGEVKDLQAPPDEENEDMGVNIGNEYHYHGIAPPDMPAAAPVKDSTSKAAKKKATIEEIAAVVASKIQPAAVAPVAADPWRKWLYAALAAAALSAGAGTPLALYFSSKQPTPPPVVDTDTDTSTDVIFPE